MYDVTTLYAAACALETGVAAARPVCLEKRPRWFWNPPAARRAWNSSDPRSPNEGLTITAGPADALLATAIPSEPPEDTLPAVADAALVAKLYFN
jgi:hypothetical protein